MLCSPHDPAPMTRRAEVARLGVLASGRGSNVGALLDAIDVGDLPAEVCALVCNVEGAGALELAAARGVSTHLLGHRDFASRRAHEDAIIEVFRAAHVEWVIMAGWMRVVTATLLDAFPDHVLNIHPSLLPSFRGMRAVEQALEAGVRITGCTVHRVHLEVDAGPILAQAAVPDLEHDTASTLHARIQRAEHHIYAPAIARALFEETL